jgi:ketosteroid isomerase-like protein
MNVAVEAKIRRLENERCRALMAGNLKALAALVDDDLVHIHASGRTDTKAEYLRGVEERFVFHDTVRSDLAIRVYGDIAIATGGLKQTVRIVATSEDRTMNIVTTQVWRLRDGSWRQVSFQATNA